MRRRTYRSAATAGTLAVLAVTLAACGGSGGSSGGTSEGRLSGASFDVGSTGFTENRILAQLTADMLSNSGAKVKTSMLSGSSTVRQAMVKGDIAGQEDVLIPLGISMAAVLRRTRFRVGGRLAGTIQI